MYIAIKLNDMTGLQKHLTDNGWKLEQGNGSYNTYTNCSNLYVKGNKKLSIGLGGIGKFSGIMVLYPILDFLPTKDYDKYINDYFSGKLNSWIKKDSNGNPLTYTSDRSRKINEMLESV